MKKAIILFTISLSLLFATTMQGQSLLAKWTFPTGNATDSLADGGLPVNLNKAIHTEGGTSAIDFSKNGASTKAAQATDWDNGANLKCWVVQVNTTGYENLKLSSKQQSGGNNPGPRDYAVQFRLGSTGSWTDVANSTLVIANDWSTGLLDSISLPLSCKDQASLYLRWIMTTNTNSLGGTVAPSGIDKIDDIYITGKQINVSVNEKEPGLALTILTNPSFGQVTVTSPITLNSLEVLDMKGRVVYSRNGIDSMRVTLNPGFASRGTYLLRVTATNGITGSKKLIVQ